MSLSLTKSLINIPVIANGLCTLSTVHLPKRNLTRTTPNHFLFGGKKSNKVEYEKLHIANWKSGTPQTIPTGNDLSYEPKDIKNPLDLYLGVMPSTSSLISTVSAEGITNTAPFALCNCISSDPPIISLTVGKKPDGSRKDTEINIDATNEFSVSIVSEWFLESSSAAAAPLPHNVSEFEKIGLTPKPSSIIKAPYVGQSAVSFECKVVSRTPLTNKDGVETTVVYNAEIVKIHINDEVYDNKTNQINYDKLKLVTALSSGKYDRINSIIDVVLPPKPTNK